MRAPAQGRCPHCGTEALWLRRPRYDGFRRVGDEFVCTACGRPFEPQEGKPTPPPAGSPLFTAQDRTVSPNPFAQDERGRLCRYCQHYVVNPFRQWCGHHRREVEATDSCDAFVARGSEMRKKKPPLE